MLEGVGYYIWCAASSLAMNGVESVTASSLFCHNPRSLVVRGIFGWLLNASNITYGSSIVVAAAAVGSCSDGIEGVAAQPINQPTNQPTEGASKDGWRAGGWVSGWGVEVGIYECADVNCPLGWG